MTVKAEQDLYLDPSIRDWVLIPITLIMVLVGVLRHYVTLLLNSAPKKQAAAAVREQRAMGRSALLRQTASLSPLPPAQYKALSTSFAAGLASGEYLKPVPVSKDEDAGPANPLEGAQMDTMMEGMKKQAVMMVPNMVIMQYINVFFSGFVIMRLPFPLTAGFKSLLSRDLPMPDLDVRWVSALSWYFLNLFGLNGVFKLILGSNNAAVDTRDLTAMSALSGAGAGMMPGPGQPDMSKLFKSEVENLALAEGLYKWVGEGIEDRVLSSWAQ
ncbi:hypothetical protein IAU60_006137 [Kwoniella sp. DSM 27419]